jgi:Flp pilus assembly protein TadD
MLRPTMALLVLAVASGCATTDRQSQSAVAVDAAARAAIEREDVLTQMTFWAKETQAHPNDLEAMRKFVEALRKGGRGARAAEVATTAIEKFGPDRFLLAGLGQSLVASGRGVEALRPLALAAQADRHDWRVRMALGIALDQAGQAEQARAAYLEALSIKPDDAGLLTNYGVSFLMTGENENAELILRQAAALPGATPETRMNLAVAIALQGRFEEAERLQRVDLPPPMVAENMAYLRSLISSPHRWQELSTGEGLRGLN